MRTIELKTKIKCCSYDELDEKQKALVDVAKKQTAHSYCPYSHFHVGAAARLKNGALFAAGAHYSDQPVESLAIACFTDGHFTKDPGSPCGACRQVMTETEHRYGGNMEVILYGEDNTYIFQSAKDLLPLVFVSENLEG